MKLFNPEDCFCEKCDRPLAFKRLESGKWCPCEFDGSDHWDICRETQVKLGRLSEHNYEPGVKSKTKVKEADIYRGSAPPWEPFTPRLEE